MKWLLMIYLMVNGEWMTADYAIENWKPSEYATEADCREVEEIATHIELMFQEEHADHYKDPITGQNPHVMNIPRKFECIQDK